MSTMYSITVVNNTENQATFCLYQEGVRKEAKSLAWLTQEAPPYTSITFKWHPNYSFVQGEAEALPPGFLFSPKQMIYVTETLNFVELIQEYGGPTFGPFGYIPGQKTLKIKCDTNVIPNQAAVGIGIAERSLLLSPASHSRTFNFTIQKRYKLACGNFKEGEVLDTDLLAESAVIDFDSDQLNYEATYNPDGSWTVQPA